MNKGGKREGSGRKSIQGKEVKLKLPFEVIDKIDKEYQGHSLSDKIRKSIDDGLYNKSEFRKYRVIDLFSGCGGISEDF